MGRLAPIFMTALCAGLARVPLVIAGRAAGNEIQASMGVVILGGLLSSTFLNMLVAPILYRLCGCAPERTPALATARPVEPRRSISSKPVWSDVPEWRFAR